MQTSTQRRTWSRRGLTAGLLVGAVVTVGALGIGDDAGGPAAASGGNSPSRGLTQAASDTAPTAALTAPAAGGTPTVPPSADRPAATERPENAAAPAARSSSEPAASTPAASTPAASTPAPTTRVGSEATSAPTAAQPSSPADPPAGDPAATLRRFLALSDAAYASPSTPLPAGLTQVAGGFVLGEVRATVQELDANRVRQNGSTAVPSVTQVEVTARSALLRACLDGTSVSLAGAVPAGAPTGERTPHLYRLQQRSGQWVVVGHDFPPQATC